MRNVKTVALSKHSLFQWSDLSTAGVSFQMVLVGQVSPTLVSHVPHSVLCLHKDTQTYHHDSDRYEIQVAK